MLEQQKILQIKQTQQNHIPCPNIWDLGQHNIEVLEDRAILLVKKTEWNMMVQLDGEEAYRLFLVLHALFKDQCGIACKNHLSSDEIAKDAS